MIKEDFPATRRAAGKMFAPVGALSSALVSCGICLQFLNLVLERQLAPLESHDFQIVDGGMGHGLIDLAFDIAVFPLQLFKMVGKRHDWFSLSWFPRTARVTGASTAGRSMTVR
jgi:hypothetical protein